jgi:eukaryotic-like serine/threonine-protein kinase
MQEFPALSPDTDTGPIPPPPDTPEILTAPHGFRLEGLLGIGGMGVVYAATQLELRRTVAIKYLRPDLPINLRTRFQAEATTIAALDHPNVLRLYAVGELGGRPYLILELIPDGSLADRLRDGPLAGREAAFLVGGAAAGIAAAHARGIVHRDLKPSNVLLSRTSRGAGTADSNGASRSDSRRPASDFVPKISDFGLAKQTADPAGATVPGRVLGTPSYMAPEQALGRDDARPSADVYSLGAILYECLTGRPPFRAATALETLDLLRSVDPVPPRQLQPGISRDLETIALKCLQKVPSARYATAADLASELERYLAGEPILARPLGRFRRAANWGLRHPDRTALAAVGLSFALVAGIALAVHEARLKAALDSKTVEEARARYEKDRADENYRRARAALRQMLDRSSDRRYADVPRAKELWAAQATVALDYFRGVAAGRDDPSTEVRYDAACAELEAYDVYASLGDVRNLAECARRAKAGFDSVLTVSDRRDARVRRAEAAGRIGLSRPGTADGILDLEEAVRELAALVANPESSRFERKLLGAMENNLGLGYHGSKNYAQAGRWFRNAYDRHRALAAEEPDDRDVARRVAENALNLVSVYQNTNRPADAAEFHRVALTVLERLQAADPTDRGTGRSLAIARVNYSYTQRTTGKADEAIAALTRSIEVLEPIYRSDPTDAGIADALLRLHGSRGEMFGAAGNPFAAARDDENVLKYSPEDRKPFRRWFQARARMRAGEFSDAVGDLEENLRSFPANGNPTELIHGAETAALMADRSRAVAAVVGGWSDSDSYLRLARRLLLKAETTAGAAGRIAFLKEVAESPHLGIVRE